MNTYDVLWVGNAGNSWYRTTLIPLSPTKTQKSASVENMAEIHPRPAEGFNENSSFNHQSLWLKTLANLWYLDGTHCLERCSHLHGATNGPWRWSRAAVVAGVPAVSVCPEVSCSSFQRKRLRDRFNTFRSVCVLFFSLTCLQKNENNGQNQTFFGQQHRDTLTQKSEREIKVVQAGL